MRSRTLAPFLGLAFLVASCGSQVGRAGPAQTAEAEVRNIILLLADGAGTGLWTAAEYAQEDLAVKRMPQVALVDTRSGSHKVTDSAAGATAYSTGRRVSNRTIAVAPECPVAQSGDSPTSQWPAGCRPLETWFAIARDAGRATGVVTTTYVVDASPAAFVAHSPSRYWYEQIADSIASFEPDVLLGGGRQYFESETREDGRDLLEEMCTSARCIFTGEDLRAYEPDDRPLVGLFAPADMDDAEPRVIGLPGMVEAALGRLERDPEGFVAFFETESTDNSTHANAPLERVTAEILEFDRAVGVALDFAGRTPGTLVIAVGDHETGGLSLAEAGTDFELRYTTGGHTAAMVPLFASGPQAERFAGMLDNDQVGQMLLEIVRGW
ncbi:MAG: alkaline phosphatase [Gemmatimonadota bacterium]